MNNKTMDEVLGIYPLTVNLKEQDFGIRLMATDDGEALRRFAQKLPDHDRLYMRRDLTSDRGIRSWITDIEEGMIYSLFAEDDDGVAGFSTIHRNRIEWTAHTADIRVTTASRARRFGLGRFLAREGFNLALGMGIEKLLARMTPDQHGARVLFEELGFAPEALLKDHVKDRNGDYHDMLMMGCNVESFIATRAAYGQN